MNKTADGRRTKDSVLDAVWMSALAGVSGVFVETVLIGSLYFFDPVTRIRIEGWSLQLLLSAVAIFAGAFGISLWFTLAIQARRGR